MFLLHVLSMLGYTTSHKSTAVSRISGLYSVWMDHGQKVKYTEKKESGGGGAGGAQKSCYRVSCLRQENTQTG